LQANTHDAGIIIDTYFRTSIAVPLAGALHCDCVDRARLGTITAAIARFKEGFLSHGAGRSYNLTFGLCWAKGACDQGPTINLIFGRQFAL